MTDRRSRLHWVGRKHLDTTAWIHPIRQASARRNHVGTVPLQVVSRRTGSNSLLVRHLRKLLPGSIVPEMEYIHVIDVHKPFPGLEVYQGAKPQTVRRSCNTVVTKSGAAPVGLPSRPKYQLAGKSHAAVPNMLLKVG